MKPISILVIFCSILLVACTGTKKVFWVNGAKTPCNMGAGMGSCLNISKGGDFNNPSWELFYAPIEGFEFEEGIAKKIRVLEKPVSNPPADGSSLSYKLLKVLETRPMPASPLAGTWLLTALSNHPINRMVPLPELEIFPDKKMITGTGGCNRYSGPINNLNAVGITFGNIAATKMACINQNIEQEYFNALAMVSKYQVQGDQLILLNNEDMPILSFLKKTETASQQRLMDIWQVQQINGTTVNYTTNRPFIEINPTEKKITGNDGCNDFFGSIRQLTNEKLSFGDLGSTRKMCPSMDVPDRFHKAMAVVAAYRLDGLTLNLLDAGGNIVIVCKKGD